MALYFGVVVPSQEYFEAIALEKTGSRDLEKLCNLIPAYHQDYINLLNNKEYLKYLECNMGNSILNNFSDDIAAYLYTSLGNIKKNYIFIGCVIEYFKFIEYEKLDTFIATKTSEYKNEIENIVRKLNLSHYEIHIFVALGTEGDMKLPDNYVPKYRKL